MYAIEKPQVLNIKTQYINKTKNIESNINNIKNYTSYKNNSVSNIKGSYFDDFSIKNYDLKYLQNSFEKFNVDIDEWFSNNQNVFTCLEILNEKIKDEKYSIFIKQLNDIINDHFHTSSECISSPINFYSFKQLILFSLSTKIQNSEIRIDFKTGKFCLFHSDKNDHESRKISLVFNEKDIIYSVLSREYGLAKLSGKFVLKQPIANHKIDLLMDLFKF